MTRINLTSAYQQVRQCIDHAHNRLSTLSDQSRRVGPHLRQTLERLFASAKDNLAGMRTAGWRHAQGRSSHQATGWGANHAGKSVQNYSPLASGLRGFGANHAGKSVQNYSPLASSLRANQVLYTDRLNEINVELQKIRAERAQFRSRLKDRFPHAPDVQSRLEALSHSSTEGRFDCSHYKQLGVRAQTLENERSVKTLAVNNLQAVIRRLDENAAVPPVTPQVS